MYDIKLLQKIQRAEQSKLIARRLEIVIASLQTNNGFTGAALECSCDRRTVSFWRKRLDSCSGSPEEIHSAFSDRPRSGRPTKISKKYLDKTKRWCKGRAFTTQELCDYMEKISGIRISMAQTRRLIKKWGYTKKMSATQYT